MKNYKYFITLFCNKKQIKIFHKSKTRGTIHEHWSEFKTQRKPRYVKIQTGKRNNPAVYELALIYPVGRDTKNAYVRDNLGRLVEAKYHDERFRIKDIIPYWVEELIYDFEIKKRIRYHEFLNKISEINEITQIYTLNNKLVVQKDMDFFVYGNKNITDSKRLLDILREDIIKKKKGNFLFIKDVSTAQRKLLYDILESKGFDRGMFFKHYSY